MNEPEHPAPTGLGRNQLRQLTDYANQSAALTPAELAAAVTTHLDATVIAHGQNPMVNRRLAHAIAGVIRQVLAQWETLELSVRPWLAGAILYFASSYDNEPDFTSPIGFEDDAEALNACLRLASLEALCLNPEDYDDV